MSELIEVRNLKKYFPTRRGMVHAVDDVSFTIEKGTTMGMVGESGCGKTTLGRVLVHLDQSTSGEINFEGRNVTDIRGGALRKYRERAQIIFQDPYSSLNPRYTVEQTIQEPLALSHRFKRSEITQKTTELMNMVGVAQRLRLSFPHELDGGRRQRVVIARALALSPDFVVCDEPVSSLDVSIRAQILNLLQDLQQERNLTYLFITHDLSVVRRISRQIYVMYLGQVVETSPSRDLFKKQYHPYAKALLSAIPSLNIHKKMDRIILKGEITSPIDPQPGCRFAARCNYALDKCHEPQKLEEMSPNRFVACCRAREINAFPSRDGSSN
jgi:oligopeptide/dipeptide ABC transporter ATP-binding protein